jgi:phage N-6-adenine-methyltransferase
MELFNTSGFSSKNDDALRDFELDVSSKKGAVKRTQPKLDPAWDDGSAFPEVSSKNIFLEEKQKDFVVGDRCQKSLIVRTCVFEREGASLTGEGDAAVPLPVNFSLFEEFEIAWKDWVVTQTEWQEEELCCISALEVWEQERSAIKDDNDSESDRPKSQVETKTSPKSKASDCWYTPPEIITLIQKSLQGITLDPCADDGKHVESCYHLTVADDGLSHPWFGRVFMNPPYSCPGVWIAKLQEEFSLGRVEEAIALVPVATDTKWFHPLISSNLICFWKGRIKFLDVNYQPKMAARQSHCLIYWGKNQSTFRQVFSPFGSFNYKQEKEANSVCSNTPVSLQESPALNLELKQPEQANSSKQNFSLKTTPTLKQSLNTDFQKSQSTATSQTITLSRENSISAQSVFPAPAQALQATEPDLTTQNQACGFKPCGALPTANPISPSSKILRGLSVGDFEQCLEDCEWSNIVGTIHKSFQQRNSERRTSAKGFSLLPTPTTYAKGSTGCRPAGATRLEQSLRKFITKGDKLNSCVPGWMMGFPVGWVESTLMDTGETISVHLPFIPEYATTSTSGEIVTTSTPDQSAPSKQQLQSSESLTSPVLQKTHRGYRIEFSSLRDASRTCGDKIKFIIFNENWVVRDYPWCDYDSVEEAELAAVEWLDKFHPGEKPTPPSKETLFQMSRAFYKERSHSIESSTSIPVVKAITLHQPWAYLVGRSKYFETRSWATNYRGKIAIHAAALRENVSAYFLLKDLLPPKGNLIFGAVVAIADLTDCILMAEEFINQQSETELRCGNWKPGYYAWKLENIQILSEPIAAKGKQGLWDVELTLSEATPEKFLEETEPQTEAVPKGKGRQRKGCLYKYIENKKLKDGTIASYPRVIGHRDPSNPTHWRWGFNWEEKVDGEWKNRSLSVKLGAIPLIQSLQKEGVSLGEIIAFIKRSKSK